MEEYEKPTNTPTIASHGEGGEPRKSTTKKQSSNNTILPSTTAPAPGSFVWRTPLPLPSYPSLCPHPPSHPPIHPLPPSRHCRGDARVNGHMYDYGHPCHEYLSPRPPPALLFFARLCEHCTTDSRTPPPSSATPFRARPCDRCGAATACSAGSRFSTSTSKCCGTC